MVRIAYFSGTGGTAKAAKAIAAAFAVHGIEANLQEIRRDNETPDGNGEMLVLLFPVHAANAPRPVHEWLDRLDPASDTPAVVISVSGGGEVFPNYGCRVSVIEKLERKGCRVVYEQTVVMPANFVEATPEFYAAELLRVLPQKAQAIVDDVLSGLERRVRVKVFDRAVSWLMRIEQRGAPGFGRGLRATEACTGCGWCARECPGSNIRMKDGKPEFLKQCVLCTRCIYGCPAKAIRASLMKRALLKDGFDLNRYETITAKSDKKQGALWEGVRRYLEGGGL